MHNFLKMKPMLLWYEDLFPSSLTLPHLYMTWYPLFPWKRNVPINLVGGQPSWEWELKFHISLSMLTQRYKSLNNLKIPGMETESGRTVRETCERGLSPLNLSSTEEWKTISPCQMSPADRAVWDSFHLLFSVNFPNTLSYSLWTSKSWERQNRPSLKGFSLLTCSGVNCKPPSHSYVFIRPSTYCGCTWK